MGKQPFLPLFFGDFLASTAELYEQGGTTTELAYGAQDTTR